jgi:flagellar biosynthesis/type III secretory pathway chaperone
MTDDVLSVLEDLDGVIQAENSVLSSFPFNGLEPLVASKTHLTARLEAMLVRRERETPGWIDSMEPQARKQLRVLIESVNSRSAVNEGLLQRQIDYSTEMIAVIATESQRMANNRSTKYTSVGRIDQFDITTPVSIDTRT